MQTNSADTPGMRSTPTALATCVAAFVIALAGTLVHAQPREQTPKELYDSGLRHYNLSEYDAALADFKLAYQKSGSPALQVGRS